MDYPYKQFTCGLCKRRYFDADGGCSCSDDQFYCTACQTFYPPAAPTYLRRERLSDGTVTARTVCADCALCEDCQAAPGTVLEVFGRGSVWICQACSDREP
jgi:hypothetical protein